MIIQWIVDVFQTARIHCPSVFSNINGSFHGVHDHVLFIIADDSSGIGSSKHFLHINKVIFSSNFHFLSIINVTLVTRYFSDAIASDLFWSFINSSRICYLWNWPKTSIYIHRNRGRSLSTPMVSVPDSNTTNADTHYDLHTTNGCHPIFWEYRV